MMAFDMNSTTIEFVAELPVEVVSSALTGDWRLP